MPRAPWLLTLLLATPCLNLGPSLAKAEEEPLAETSYVVRKITTEGNIKNLRWEAEQHPVLLQEASGARKLFAIIKGSFTQKNGKLLHEGKLVALGPGGSFSLRIALTGPTTPFRLNAVGLLGELQKEIFSLSFPKYSEAFSPPKPDKRGSYAADLGVSQLKYDEVGVMEGLSELALTLKAQASWHLFNGRWEIGMGGYFNLLPLTKNKALGLRALGLNARAGYVLPLSSSKWTITLLVGEYYTTTLVSDKSFGFRDLFGPQLFPKFAYRISEEKTLAGYFKIAPLPTSGGSLLSLTARELALGLGYRWSRQSRFFHGVSLDFSTLETVISGRAISLRTTTLGFSHQF